MDFNVSNIASETVDLLAEINKLIMEKEQQSFLINKKPADILKNRNYIERAKELTRFNWINQLYVIPIYEFANRINYSITKEPIYFPDFDSLTIIERIIVIRNYLTKKGCSKETLLQLIPTSEKEVETLLMANSQGFDLSFTKNQPIWNSDRLNRAQIYLEQIEILSQGSNGKSK